MPSAESAGFVIMIPPPPTVKMLLVALHISFAGDELVLLQMGNQQVSQSNAKLTVARTEVRKVSRHLTACVLPENSYLWHVCNCSMYSECLRCVMV